MPRGRNIPEEEVKRRRGQSERDRGVQGTVCAGTGESWYQGNLFWGATGLGVGLLSAVLGTMLKDVRWLLWVSWPFFSLAIWVAFKGSGSLRKYLKYGMSVATLLGLIWLYRFLEPKAVVSEESPEVKVFNGLRAEILNPAGAKSIANATVTVTNNSAIPITDFQLTCTPNVIAMVGGGGIRATGSPEGSNPYGFVRQRAGRLRLEAGGDTVSDPCVNVNFVSKVKCADVSVLFKYQIENGGAGEKHFRFATQMIGGVQTWSRQPINYIDTDCVFERPPQQNGKRDN